MASKKELRALITLAGKIDPSLSTALMKASGESAKLTQKLKQNNTAFKQGKESGSKFGDMLKASFLGNLASNAVSKLASTIKDLGLEALNMASDLTEVQNVVDVAFGSNANQIDKWSKGVLKNYGITELQAKSWAGSMGAMLKSSGLAQDDVLSVSTNLAGLAGDFASFYNLDHDTAWEKIRSGISGETEPLKQLGINMSVANLEQFAMNKGINKAFKDMTQAEQTLLRYNYLVENSNDAQGDYSRTLETSWENQKRLLKNSIMSKASSALSKFIPLLTKLTSKVNKFVDGIDVDKLFDKVNDAIGYIQKGVQFVQTILTQAKPYIKELFEYGKGLIEKYAPYIVRIGESFGKLVQVMISTIIPILGNVWTVLEPIVFKLIEMFTPVFEKLVHLIEVISPAIIFLSSVITTFLGNAFTTLEPVINGFIQNFEGIIDFLTGVFTGDLELAWNGILGIFSGAVNAIQELIKLPINLTIDGINTLLGGINNLSIPEWVPIVGGRVVNIPLIPKFALGGIATQASIFGEAGPEMAIPLKRTSRSLGLLQQTAQILGVGGSTKGNTIIININGGDLAEVKRVIKEVLEDTYEDEGRVSFA